MAILGILAGIITVAVLYPVMFSGRDDFAECMSDFFDFNFFNDPDVFWDQIKFMSGWVRALSWDWASIIYNPV